MGQNDIVKSFYKKIVGGQNDPIIHSNKILPENFRMRFKKVTHPFIFTTNEIHIEENGYRQTKIISNKNLYFPTQSVPHIPASNGNS
jgi:hypothetical protein